MKQLHYEETGVSHFLFANTKISILWLIVRVYVGWEWLSAGWDKFNNPMWWGDGAGKALTGFIQGSLSKTGGAHPDVQSWYATFLHDAILPNVFLMSHIITAGEILVGIALIAGFLVELSAFFGVFMNLNFLLAGTVSVNPILLILGIFLMLAWRTAGYIGLDYYVLPKLHRLSKISKIPKKIR
jgi:thiosulfate dehydrogenase [quinone] large subunit